MSGGQGRSAGPLPTRAPDPTSLRSRRAALRQALVPLIADGGGVMRDPGVQATIAAQTALGRVGQPDDIGVIAAALLAPDAGWITGQRIEATGGYML